MENAISRVYSASQLLEGLMGNEECDGESESSATLDIEGESDDGEKCHAHVAEDSTE